MSDDNTAYAEHLEQVRAEERKRTEILMQAVDVMVEANAPKPKDMNDLRDWFAGQALAGFLADGSQRKIARHIEESADATLIQDDKAKTAIINRLIGEAVYLLADAMIEARK